MSSVYELYLKFKETDTDDSYRRTLNDIRDRWNTDVKRLPYVDKPYSNVVYPLKEDLTNLLERMHRDYEWKELKCPHEKFRDTFVDAYEFREELRHCGYNHDVW